MRMPRIRQRIDTLFPALALLLLPITLAGHLRAAQPAEVSSDFVPALNLILVPVQINGARPALFVFDTGLEQTLIDARYAGELGLRIDDAQEQRVPGGTLRIGMVKEGKVTIGGAYPQTLPLQTAPLESLAAVTGEHVKGLIGHDFIKRFGVKIDYGGKKLTLWPADEFHYRGSGVALPIRISDSQVFLSVRIKPRGQPPLVASFKLDTGSADVIGFNNNFIQDHHLIDPRQPTLRMPGVAMGGETAGHLFRLDWCRLGPTTVADPIVGYTSDSKGFENRQDAGTIGAAILSLHTLFLDYAHQRIILEPVGPGSRRVPSDEVGATLRARGPDLKDIVIASIIPGSPAAEAGLRTGDHIAAIDGKTGSSLASIAERFRRGGKVRVTVQREGASQSFEVNGRPLLPP
jgi:hypothetical protein